jgi:hypothetical protein
MTFSITTFSISIKCHDYAESHFYIVMLSVNVPSVVMLSIIMPSVVMLSVVMSSVVKLNVAAPKLLSEYIGNFERDREEMELSNN